MDKGLADKFKKNVGSFVVVDYQTPNGSTETAMGKLESVSDDGQVYIIHLKDPRISWGFNLNHVVIERHKFSPIKDGGEKDV